ncbi:MAG: hypothetical protein ACRD3F_01805 [Acidobacteriaceae bacterium]
MKTPVLLLIAVCACGAAAQSTASTPAPAERLGTVSFATSCAPAKQAAFNRGVALLHDFWYAEARQQFEQIAQADPGCAMAHWGIAMSVFHQIWDRPGENAMHFGWSEIRKAESLKAKTARERQYIAALGVFYKPGSEDYMARVSAYSAAMDKLYRHYPDDVDAGAFYALSLLSAESPNDTSLTQQREAMAVLRPLFAKYPDNPGVVHYIIHACDNPAMASQGLKAAEHYGEIAPSGAHAAHMPGHIFARLGMWPQDIQAQLASIAASEAAERHHESGIMDEAHSYDFLMYAYLQSGQDAKAKAVIAEVDAVLKRVSAMPGGGHDLMSDRNGYYLTKFPVFYALETRDWKSAAALQPVAGALPGQASMTWWARAIADGHLRRAQQAQADLAQYDALIAQMRKGSDAYEADSTGAKIERDEIVAWVSFAAGKQYDAVANMRKAADLQDKVGQGEVDIPAREMMGDMLLESHEPKMALAEYRISLKLSPGRFNGLYHAGIAAEESGDKAAAARYYAALLKTTEGAEGALPQLAHARTFLAANQTAEN